MRLIRDNHLYESILDDIDATSTAPAAKTLSNSIHTRPEDYEVIVYFMLLIHSRD